MWTKRQICAAAFEELALAGYTFDLTPEEMQSAMVRLDMMLAQWLGNGINLGYSFGLTPDEGDLDDDSGIPLIHINAVVLNLATQLAAGKGKTLAQTTRSTAKQAYDSIVSRLVKDSTKQQQLPSGLPLGAGYKRVTRQPFTTPPTFDPVQAGPDGGLEFN